MLDEKNNTKLANKSFKEKKALLVAAQVPLDRTLSDATAWTFDEIKSRTAELAKGERLAVPS